jgi:hypothetical protein
MVPQKIARFRAIVGRVRQLQRQAEDEVMVYKQRCVEKH